MRRKRLIALVLSAAMVAGNSAVAFAADMEGGEQGKGEVQYVATSDVFSVVLPTEKASGTASTFDYLLDPDGLIAATKTQTDKRYTGEFEDGKTLYFKHAAQVNGKDYTDTSDELKVINKSTQGVVLTVTAKVAAADGVTMDADGTFSAAAGAGNLYLALVGKVSGETNDTIKALTADGVTASVTIPADENAYAVTWNATAKQYEKALTSAAAAAGYSGFKDYTFKLTGACKANDASLLALKENPPKIDLTWSVKDFTVTGPQITVSASGAINITGLTESKDYVSVDITAPNNTKYDINTNPVNWDTSNWSSGNGGSITGQLGNEWMTWLVSEGGNITLTLNLSDHTTATCTQTLSN